MAEVIAQAKANVARLEGCGGHQFVRDLDQREIWPDEVCTRCGGRVSSMTARWYKLGLQHGAADV